MELQVFRMPNRPLFLILLNTKQNNLAMHALHNKGKQRHTCSLSVSCVLGFITILRIYEATMIPLFAGILLVLAICHLLCYDVMIHLCL